MGSVFRLDRLNRMRALKNRYFLPWVEKISEYPCPRCARFHAGRLEPRIDSVRAEGALLNDLLDRVHIPDCIRTCHHTIPASDAGMGIDDDDAIFPFKRGFRRTDGDTARVVTVIAEDGQKGFSYIRIGTLFDLFDPCLPYTERNLVFRLAGHLTGVAADTATKIDNHAVFNLVH